MCIGGTNKRTDIYVVHLVEMHIYYLLECIASRDVLKRVLSLIIQHIVDSGYTDFASCYVTGSSLYMLQGHKLVSSIKIYRSGFDLIRVQIDQHVSDH